MKNLPLVRIPPSLFLQLRKGSPWIFRDSPAMKDSFHHLKTLLPRGGWVRISSSKNPAGLALFDPDNAIALRVFDSSPEEVPVKPFLFNKLSAALEIRANIDQKVTSGFRLVHGEHDHLPGLVADIYDKLLVFRPDCAAWIDHLDMVTEFLARKIEFDAAWLSYSRESRWLLNQVSLPVKFQENSLHFIANPQAGQKTGFFLDMRENRKATGQFAQNKKILNCFSYTGGFSVYARAGGALETVNVDISEGAMEDAKTNHALNGFDDDKTSYVVMDAFEYIEQLPEIPFKKIRTQKGPFDMIILDPPAFAHSKEKIEAGIEAYTRLNQTALKRLGQNQYLATASCSSRISNQQFLEAVLSAAQNSGRKLRCVYFHGAGPDHPTAFETSILPYLKFYIFAID